MKKIIMSWLLVLFCGVLFAQVTDTSRNDRNDTTYRNQHRNRNDSNWRNRDTMNRNRRDNHRNRDTMNRNRNDSNWRNRSRGDSSMRMNPNRMRRNEMDTARNRMRRNMRQTRDTMVVGSENQWNSSGNTHANALNGNTWNEGETDYMAEAALPVLISYVPDDVVSSFKSNYGNGLYSITCVKLDEDDYAYSVVTIENGKAHYITVDGDGGEITYPPADDNLNNSVNENMNNRQEMNENQQNQSNNQ